VGKVFRNREMVVEEEEWNETLHQFILPLTKGIADFDKSLYRSRLVSRM
jgi:hypothetical protein